MTATEAAHWCHSHFALLANGGVWAVPRSGLVFQRRNAGLVLVQREPRASEGLTVSAWLQLQAIDFVTIQEAFCAAGIPVTLDTTQDN